MIKAQRHVSDSSEDVTPCCRTDYDVSSIELAPSARARGNAVPCVLLGWLLVVFRGADDPLMLVKLGIPKECLAWHAGEPETGDFSPICI